MTREQIAVMMLHGLLVSTPLCDRTTVNKRKWAEAAVEFADALANALISPKRKRRKLK